MAAINTAKYVDIPFKAGGRSREEGLDCWGLLRLVYSECFGIELPSYEEAYAARDVLGRGGMPLLAGLIGQGTGSTEWQAVPKGREQAGDAIWIRIGRHRSHTAVVVEPGWMLHVLEGTAVTCERYRQALWKDRVVGFYRHRESSRLKAESSKGLASP